MGENVDGASWALGAVLTREKLQNILDAADDPKLDCESSLKRAKENATEALELIDGFLSRFDVSEDGA